MKAGGMTGRNLKARTTSFGAIGALLLGTALAGSLFAAQYGSKTEGAVERGHKQFEQTCSFCHGLDATGARGPDLVRSQLVADDVDGNLIGPVVRNGRPSKGMPAFPLSDQQIADLAAYLHARRKEAILSARVPKVYPLSRLLTGNATAGKAFFNGTGGCKACHSPAGDLAHIATKLPPLELEARMLYPGGAERTVTVIFPSGRRMEGKLVHSDEFNVALRDSSGWYHSYSLGRVKAEVHDPLAAHRELLNHLTQADVHNLFAFLETLK
jgi:cytochrome c oxidase cbb3-type subunit 3